MAFVASRVVVVVGEKENGDSTSTLVSSRKTNENFFVYKMNGQTLGVTVKFL